MPGTSSTTRVPTIAVVAVHGVGNEKQFQTARTVGDLLQEMSTKDGSGPAYYPFREQQLRLTVRPVVVQSDVKMVPRTAMRAPLAAHVDAIVAGNEALGDPDSLSHRFMREQLGYYKGEEPQDTYETIRLEGRRAPQEGDAARDVHVYELHWTDLCRLKNRLFSILGELFQLMFHLSILGSQTVGAAAAAHSRSTAWQRLRWWQERASLSLSMLIPAVNLLLLGVVSVLVALGGFSAIGPRFSTLIVVSSLAGVAALLAGWALWERPAPQFAAWIAPALAWVAIVGTAGWVAWNRDFRWDALALRVGEGIVAAGAAAGIVYFVASVYEQRRPGFLKLLGLLALLLAIAPVTLLWVPAQTESASGFFLREFEIVYSAMFLSWCVFHVCAVVAFLAGISALNEIKPGTPDRDLAERSRWTGRLMLALPASIFLSVSAILWELIARAAKAVAPDVAYTPILSILPNWSAYNLGDVAAALLNGPFERTVPVILLALLAAAVPGLWGLAPSAFMELFPPKAKSDPRGETSGRLGNWLTRAFSGLKISGILIYACVIVAVPVLALATLRWGDLGTSKFYWVGLLSGTAALTVMIAPRELEKVALGFRTVLDVMLDVDTWLREFPREASPKARICGRYVSLLRYICNWREPESGARYDAIVIIAHSQGTVISSELLRFLQRESRGDMHGYDPELARLTPPEVSNPDRIPVLLFTLGCPLRQLYSLRFPYLYGWVSPESFGTRKTGPDVSALGVDLWLNGYRSGDYVGRYLWSSIGDQALYEPRAAEIPAESGARSEFCLGAGAHTHYWDNTGFATAVALDGLIRQRPASRTKNVTAAS